MKSRRFLSVLSRQPFHTTVYYGNGDLALLVGNASKDALGRPSQLYTKTRELSPTGKNNLVPWSPNTRQPRPQTPGIGSRLELYFYRSICPEYSDRSGAGLPRPRLFHQFRPNQCQRRQPKHRRGLLSQSVNSPSGSPLNEKCEYAVTSFADR